MTTISLVFPGPPEQRQVVKITAMQPLSAVLPAACAKFKPALNPTSVKLTLNKKPVDMDSPFRLANIPAGSILTVSAATVTQPVAQPAGQPAAAVTASSSAAAPGDQQLPVLAATPATTAAAAAPTSLPPPTALTPPAPIPTFTPPAPIPAPAPAVNETTAAIPAVTQQLLPTAIPTGLSPPGVPQANIPPAQPPQAIPMSVAPFAQPVKPVAAVPTLQPFQPSAQGAQPPPAPEVPMTTTGQQQALPAQPTIIVEEPMDTATPSFSGEQGTGAATASDSGAAGAGGLAGNYNAILAKAQWPVAAESAAETAPETAGPAETVSSGAAEGLSQLGVALGWSPAREAFLTTEAALQQQAIAIQEAEAAATAGQGPMEVDGGPGAGAGGEEDDSFHELTPEDLAVLVRAAEAKRKEEAGGLKTQAMRDAEDRAKMQACGPVALRLLFPDGVVLQAAFKASDKLQLVLDVVRTLLAHSATPISLFITPPKQVLKDMDVTLYKAGLVPAALVHVQLPATAGPTLGLLRPEAAACMQPTLAIGQLLPGRKEKTATETAAETAAAERKAKRTAAMAARAAGGGGASGSGGAGGSGSSYYQGPGGPQSYNVGTSKLPKWMQRK